MTENPLEFLCEEQERLGLIMLRHCHIILRRRYGWSPGKVLPRGKDPETVVDDVIRKYLQGDRNFSANHSVEAQLKKGVESWLSAIHSSKDAATVSLEAMTKATGQEVRSDQAQPDSDVMNSHDTQVLFGFLLENSTVRKNEELQLLVMAIEDGADDPESQSAATDLPIGQIYELRKKLRAITPAVLDKFNQEPLKLT